MANDNLFDPTNQDTPMRINCMLIRRENSALFDELASFQKGPRRTARLKFLAYEGLRHLQQLVTTETRPTRGAGEPGEEDHEAEQVLSATQATYTSEPLPPTPGLTRAETVAGIAAEIFGEPVEDARPIR